jgi:pimeloyl-ACP methyl ester carboxylesterase
VRVLLSTIGVVAVGLAVSANAQPSSREQSLRRPDGSIFYFDLSAGLSTVARKSPSLFPVLLLYGDTDAVGATTSPEIAALMPQAEVHVVARSGHYPWIESPAPFYTQLDRLITRSDLRP